MTDALFSELGSNPSTATQPTAVAPVSWRRLDS